MSVYDALIKRVLGRIGRETNYYVYGGKALSVLLPSITSVDWDVVVQGPDTYRFNIVDFIKKLSRFTVDIERLSSIRLRAGEYQPIYQISINNSPVMDVKFVDTITLPVVVVDTINYLDINGLYDNILIAIEDGNDVVDYWKKMSERNPKQIISSKVKERTVLIDELYMEIRQLRGSDRPNEIQELEDEIQSLRQEISHLESSEYLQEQYKELDRDMENSIQEYTVALQLNKKNNIRLYILNEALLKPSLFNPKYIHILCEECMRNYGEMPVRTVGSTGLYCNQLNCS